MDVEYGLSDQLKSSSENVEVYTIAVDESTNEWINKKTQMLKTLAVFIFRCTLPVVIVNNFGI